MSAGTPRPAAVWPLRWPGRRRSALSESLWQRAAAQGAAAAAGPGRHAAPRLQSGTVSFGRCVDTPNVTRFTCCGLVICNYCCCFQTEARCHNPAFTTNRLWYRF